MIVPASPTRARGCASRSRSSPSRIPLIDVRQDEARQELSVSLYGEVQKEVIRATLANDFGIEVEFRETTPICVERPSRTGEAVEILNAESNPFLATIGLRVEPAPSGSGVGFRLEVDARTSAVPLQDGRELHGAHGRYVHTTLREGSSGGRSRIAS